MKILGGKNSFVGEYPRSSPPLYEPLGSVNGKPGSTPLDVSNDNPYGKAYESQYFEHIHTNAGIPKKGLIFTKIV